MPQTAIRHEAARLLEIFDTDSSHERPVERSTGGRSDTTIRKHIRGRGGGQMGEMTEEEKRKRFVQRR
jgi:hypothetical protein